MALRDASEVGVPDVRRFAGLQVTAGEDRVAEPPRARRPRGATAAATPLALTASGDVASRLVPAPPAAAARLSTAPADAVDLLGDERLVYLQVDVPQIVLQRVKEASFELAAEHRHLCRHQTILGALVWRHVDHTDQAKLDALADLVDAYAAGPWHGLPEVRRLSGRMAASLKRRMEGAVLTLTSTHRDVSAKAVVAGLVWRHVVSADDDPAGFSRLVDVLSAYHQEASRRSLGAPLAHAT